MTRFFFAFMISLALLVAGCSSHDGIIIPADEAWFSFSGDTRGAMLSLDGAPGMLLRPSGYDKNSSDKQKWYQVIPGKHTVHITRDGNTIVERVVLVGKGQTMEIYIP